jgi:hypothetical protein
MSQRIKITAEEKIKFIQTDLSGKITQQYASKMVGVSLAAIQV